MTLTYYQYDLNKVVEENTFNSGKEILKNYNNMKNIESYNFTGKKVLVRVDFNVPLNEKFEITDTSRIDAAIPTIKKILSGGGSAILMSHLGRPKEGPTQKYSLKHTLGYLSSQLGQTVKFADDCIGESAITLAGGLKPGEVLVARKPPVLQGGRKRR